MKLDELSTKITGSVQVAVKRICNQSKPKGSKLRANTLAILEKRRKMSKETEKYKDLNRVIRKEIRKDLRSYNTQLVCKAIYENANMRVLRSKMTWGKTQIAKMKNGQEEITTKKTDIIAIIENFYRKLYSTSVSKPDHMANRSRKNILNVGSEEIPEIDKNELRTALKKMKNEKTEKTE